MIIEKFSPIHKLVMIMFTSRWFLDTLDETEVNLLRSVYITDRYRSRQRRKLNEIRKKWISYIQ